MSVICVDSTVHQISLSPLEDVICLFRNIDFSKQIWTRIVMQCDLDSSVTGAGRFCKTVIYCSCLYESPVPSPLCLGLFI